MAVDGTVIDIDLVVISRIHELVPVFNKARTLSECEENKEFSHRQANWLTIPRTDMAVRIEHEAATNNRLLIALNLNRAA